VWSRNDRPSRWWGQHPHVVHRPCQILILVGRLSETPVPIKFIFSTAPKPRHTHDTPPACVAVCFYSSSSSPLIAFLVCPTNGVLLVGHRFTKNILRLRETSHLPKYKPLSLCDALLGDVICRYKVQSVYKRVTLSSHSLSLTTMSTLHALTPRNIPRPTWNIPSGESIRFDQIHSHIPSLAFSQTTIEHTVLYYRRHELRLVQDLP
jgi:hypothetical protein